MNPYLPISSPKQCSVIDQPKLVSYSIQFVLFEFFTVYTKLASNGSIGIKGFNNSKKLPPVGLDLKCKRLLV